MTDSTPILGTGTLVAVYGVAAVCFLALDMLWLGVLARGFYRQHMGHLLAAQVNWGAALLFYAVFLAGLVLFVLKPSLEAGSAVRALTHGAFFGLVTYATYDLTNHATMRDWPAIVTVADLAWGATISGVVAFATHTIAARWLHAGA
jgi:uncharacterized membrane protein